MIINTDFIETNNTFIDLMSKDENVILKLFIFSEIKTQLDLQVDELLKACNEIFSRFMCGKSYDIHQMVLSYGEEVRCLI